MKWYSYLPFLNEHTYERYLPTAFDESMTLLQKVNKVIEGLNTVIQAMNKTFEEVDKQNDKITAIRDDFETLKEWLENEGLQERTVWVLNEWFDSGRLAQIINNDVFNMKVDKTTFEQFVVSTNQQLTQIEQDLTTQLQHMKENVIYIETVARLDGETDDSGRLQRAIDSFEGNFAGTIVITGDIVLDNPVTCHKTGLRLIGVSNKKSRIIIRHGGIGIHIKPLINGAPYTSVPYCKFFIEDLAIVAEGDACESGTGLFIQWIFASSFRNLYTSGFKKHVVMKGCHLNTFFNLYQGNVDSSEYSVEIHNRGVGLSFDADEDETGQNTSNNNTIKGGWINNTTIDLRGATETVIENVDFEPTSNSVYSGNRNTFRDCRFERMDLYAVEQSLYPRFPWFIVGHNCKFENNTIHNAGPNNANAINPVFLVNGKNNVIHIPETIWFNFGLLTFGAEAEHNTIYDRSSYVDYTTINEEGFRSEHNMYLLNGKPNTIIHVDTKTNNRVELNGDYLKGTGRFTNVSSVNDNLQAVDMFYGQGVDISPINIPLPFSRTEPNHFARLEIQSDGTGLNRFILNPGASQTAQKDGVYTFSALLFIPTIANCYVTVGPYLDGITKFSAKGIWTCVQSRRYFKKDEQIIPTVNLFGGEGHSMYVGEISVTEGNNGLFIPNNTQGSISKMF